MFEVTCNEENAKTIDVAGVAECISAVKINIFHCLPHKVSLTDTVRSQLLITSGSERGKKIMRQMFSNLWVRVQFKWTSLTTVFIKALISQGNCWWDIRPGIW